MLMHTYSEMSVKYLQDKEELPEKKNSLFMLYFYFKNLGFKKWHEASYETLLAWNRKKNISQITKRNLSQMHALNAC